MQFYRSLSDGCLYSTCWCVIIYIFILGNPFLSSFTCIVLVRLYVLCSGIFSCLLGKTSLELLKCQDWRWMMKVGHRKARVRETRIHTTRPAPSPFKLGVGPGRTELPVYVSARKLTLAKFPFFLQRAVYLCAAVNIVVWSLYGGRDSYPVWVQEWTQFIEDEPGGSEFVVKSLQEVSQGARASASGEGVCSLHEHFLGMYHGAPLFALRKRVLKFILNTDFAAACLRIIWMHVTCILGRQRN